MNTTKSRTLSLVNELKSANEDFEYYPTSSEMIQVVFNDVKTILETHDFHSSYGKDLRILDIGAGDGRVLLNLKEQLSAIIPERQSIELLAIEKSTIQIEGYRQKDIALIGTEFNETNLISKNADIAFVNPPYQHFNFWLASIISQVNFGLLYAIVPKRWREDGLIKQAIESRQINDVTVLKEMDFLEADRAARANVEIIRFSFNKFEEEKEKSDSLLKSRKYHYTPIIGVSRTDPFQKFIENELGLKKTYSNTTSEFNEHCEVERIKKQMKDESSHSFELVKHRGVLSALIANYESDLSHVLSQYKKIGELDASILQELGVKHDDLLTGVKEKLLGYRNVYWSLLFDHLDALTDRLISKHKSKLLNTLKANALDFTHANAVYIVSYAVQIGNELIEESIVDVYKALTCESSISRYYASNQHVYKDNWRHNQFNREAAEKAKYQLDYRFVMSSYGNFSSHSWEQGLSESARNFTSDLMVVFKLLGYSNIFLDKQYHNINGGDSIIIMGTDPHGTLLHLAQIRFYKNGNRHIKFNQDAMLRFNVTASRILGWVRSKNEFEQENDMKKSVSTDIWVVADEMKIQPTYILALTNKTAA
ncbi:DUF4942 domain-containing protein [Vibrio cholerae]|nr:DUF4942 domain-containing protein [Vibrio cholerae]